MKRNHFFNVMAVCAALSFVACSGQKETSEQVEEETVQLGKLLRLWSRLFRRSFHIQLR